MMSTYKPTTGFAPVYRGSLYYEVSGSGQPVLLIHAGLADCSMWDAQFNFLRQYYRVIRYDVRGFGQSRTETTEFSTSQDVLDLLQHLNVQRASLIGISLGGRIAIDFTLEHPDRVTSLVVVAPGVGGHEYHPDGSDESRQEYDLFNQMDDLWEKKEFDKLADLHIQVWVDGPSQPIGRASPQIREYIREYVRASFDRQDGHPTSIPLTPPAIDRLSEIHIPTLVLVGEYDTRDLLALADKLHEDIPGAQKIVFAGTAHMIPMEQPDKFNEVVLNFLRIGTEYDHLPSPHR